MSSMEVTEESWSTSIREEANFTEAFSTPIRRPTCFSILVTNEGQEKSWARRTVSVWVAVLLLIDACLGAGRVSRSDVWNLRRIGPDFPDAGQVLFRASPRVRIRPRAPAGRRGR